MPRGLEIFRTFCPIGIAAGVAVSVIGCGSGHPAATGHSTAPATAAQTATAPAQPARRPPPYPVALRGARESGPIDWTPAVEVGGQVAAWVKRTDSVTLARFDQRFVTLALHAGATDPGGSGWRYGPAVGTAERRRLVSAFNGGFRLNTDSGGFVSYGRVGAPLQFGRASAVTYTDGTTDVGAWRQGVPAPGRAVAAVRQTLQLLVDHGQPAATVNGCGAACWGAPLHGAAAVARSALGVTSAGRLVWAGGEDLTVAALADALVGAGVERAMELDINPDWVHGFLYAHPGVTALPLIAAQSGGPDLYLTPTSRDFFTILARP